MGCCYIINIIFSVFKSIYTLPLIFSVLLFFFPLKYALLVSLTFLLGLYWKRCIVIISTFPRDVRYIYKMWSVITTARAYGKNNLTVAQIFRSIVKERPDNICLLCDGDPWTFKKVEEVSNRIANALQSEGMVRGDVIALLMASKPLYVAVWLGASKLGVITALINPNLRGDSLLHSVSVSNAKAIIFAPEFEEDLRIVCVKTNLTFYRLTDNLSDSSSSDGEAKFKMISMNKLMSVASAKYPEVKDPPGYSDKLLYIFTSGTTGLPKAAVIPNSRYILCGTVTNILLDLRRDVDILYNPLPLSHTSGGCLGVGPALVAGVTVAVRTKFSASAYFTDCIKFNATIGMYIGEMCRYLLATPEKPTDTQHKLRTIVGNGLRPAIWKQFMDRFQIPRITEFYGATEGNVNMLNLDNKIGAIGIIPRCLPSWMYPINIIKVHQDTSLPLRNKYGLCERCEPGEPGMLVGIIQRSDLFRRFEGYVQKDESKKKIITDVFKKGDSAFISGDLVVMDDLGYIYFRDRTGDTFRWKGENVATGEVEAVLIKAGYSDCAVYGVQIGDLEGRAGTAALVLSLNKDDSTNNNDDPLVLLAALFDSSLPAYARPLFLRILPSIELTATFKLKKTDLQKLGIDPSSSASPADHKLLFRKGNTYIPLTPQIYSGITSGQIKL